MLENREYLLVLDVGTGSGRAILFNLAGEIIGFKGREWQHEANPNYRGALDFDVEANWLSLVQSIREVMAKTAVAADEVKAISITSMRHGMVCYDGKGCSIAAYPNADARAEDEVKWLIRTGIAKQIYKIGGDWPSVHDVARLLWLKKNQARSLQPYRPFHNAGGMAHSPALRRLCVRSLQCFQQRII